MTFTPPAFVPKYAKPVIWIGLTIVFILMMVDIMSEPVSVKNPDPNHTHADFAVWVNGTKLDFSDARYMTGESTQDHTHDESLGPLRKYLHLHDGIGYVMHRHKPGLTIGNFFSTIGFTMTKTCFTLDAFQFSKLDTGWVKSFAITKNLCTNGKFHWMMYVNAKAVPFDPAFSFADGDKILLTYDAADDHSAQLTQMTDGACRYSKTCPWKGAPPAENCISDPTVPCVAP